MKNQDEEEKERKARQRAIGESYRVENATSFAFCMVLISESAYCLLRHKLERKITINIKGKRYVHMFVIKISNLNCLRLCTFLSPPSSFRGKNLYPPLHICAKQK